MWKLQTHNLDFTVCTLYLCTPIYLYIYVPIYIYVQLSISCWLIRDAGLAITRTLGDHCLKKGSTQLDSTGLVADPYVSDVISIQSGDILLLASDGVCILSI